MDTAVNRDLFLEKLNALIAGKREDNCFYFSQEKYSKILSEVVSAKTKCNTPLDYRRLKRFDVLKINDEEKLIVPLKPGETDIQYYVTNEELFSILYETHTRIGHGGRTRMLKELQVKYKNITYEVVMLYLNLCKQCQMKHSAPKKATELRRRKYKSSRHVEHSPLVHGEIRHSPDFDDYVKARKKARIVERANDLRCEADICSNTLKRKYSHASSNLNENDESMSTVSQIRAITLTEPHRASPTQIPNAKKRLEEKILTSSIEQEVSRMKQESHKIRSSPLMNDNLAEEISDTSTSPTDEDSYRTNSLLLLPDNRLDSVLHVSEPEKTLDPLADENESGTSETNCQENLAWRSRNACSFGTDSLPPFTDQIDFCSDPACKCCQATVLGINKLITLYNLQRNLMSELLDEVRTLRYEIRMGTVNKSRNNISVSMFNKYQCLKFPIASRDMISLFETILRNEVDYCDAVEEIANIGGTSNYNFVKRVMSLLMTDDVALTYSWLGRKGKLSFNNLRLANLIIDAAEKAGVSKTRKETETSIQAWLRHASDRKVSIKRISS